jgi:N,N'-diacetyllegionaminate synthase
MSDKVYIIAEIGNNHEGDFTVAQKMVEAAATTGVDAVKFQTFKTEHFISPSTPERFEKLKSFELSYDQFIQLSELCKNCGVDFISTPFDLDSVKFLNDIVAKFKIASSDVNLYPLIGAVAKTGKDMILSTGTADMSLLKNTKSFIEETWSNAGLTATCTFLHCITSYPVEAEHANLNAIPAMCESLKAEIGYSDHTIGNTAAVIATTMGAKIIEKHFTLDHNYSDFRDHQLSCEPQEMKELVDKVRETEKMLGSKEKVVSACEKDIIPAVRRSICAKTELKKGQLISEDNLIWTRPAGEGYDAGEENSLLGKTLSCDMKQGEAFISKHFN